MASFTLLSPISTPGLSKHGTQSPPTKPAWQPFAPILLFDGIDRENLNTHRDLKGHWPKCDVCDAKFENQLDRKKHVELKKHWIVCEVCQAGFETKRSCEQHKTAKGHWARDIQCQTCNRMFCTQEAVEAHMRAKGHFRVDTLEY
ncbi:zinc finger, c2h2 [Trichoderma arundinaceum]|uniref:Zinc finger, c2h2 n=1 Tax=Trichoderma arundinaceum TaxID=490622 RepID=A0A395NYG4_TRIAR|nr:zinc finger, c2h2 [Trichoderma arundinaceum]